ncbi:MAG: PqqD family protein [Candidatus Aenigmatarchaeota archaeon]
MNEGKKPQRVRELIWSKAGDVYLLLDKETNETYTLDPIAFLVWVQCDGKSDIEQIVDVFSVNGNRDIVKAAILGILEKLQKSGLIKWV